MKLALIFLSLFSYSISAEVSRSPAVVAEICDLEIPTTQIQKDSEKIFKDKVSHVVVISSEGNGCETFPNKRFPDSTYEDYALQEMKVLFQKYPTIYTKKCNDYFKSLGLKDYNFECAQPVVEKIKISDYKCEKRVEEISKKISYIGIGSAEVQFASKGIRIEEKSVGVVQKEQCARVNECMGQASDKDMPELKKLAGLACKGELTPVNTARAPAVEADISFDDGSRNPKSETKTNSVIEKLNSAGK